MCVCFPFLTSLESLLFLVSCHVRTERGLRKRKRERDRKGHDVNIERAGKSYNK